MKLPPDMGLWDWVKRTVAPLGQPQPHRAQLIPAAMLFQPTLDLHGLTVQEAYETTLSHLRGAKSAKIKTCLIITGKGRDQNGEENSSGQIRREFPMWLEDHPFVTHITEENGGGAFKVHLN